MTGSDDATSVVRRLRDLPHRAADERTVALTFDDGPHPVWTPQVLDALAALDAPATFFVLGAEVAQHPHLVERMVREGHTLGNHSWSHARGHADDTDVEEEVGRTDDLLRELTGTTPAYFRPPYRRTDARLYQEALERRDLLTVLWSVDPKDWRGGSAREITDATLLALHPGAIVLLHDGGLDRARTVEAVPMIVAGVRDLGYRLVAM